jgi:hydroxylamine dehydrogenase
MLTIWEGLMEQQEPRNFLRSARLLVFGLVAVIVVVGFVLIVMAINRPVEATPLGHTDVLADSTNACVTCHRNATPAIVSQFSYSTMAAAKVTCQDCHVVDAGYPGSVEHEGVTLLASPTPAMCQHCHTQEVAQFYQSRHSLPAYVAYAGTKDLTPANLVMYQSIPEAQAAPDVARSALFAVEDARLTSYGCVTCHSVGAPHSDSSVGECQKCHLRHAFSLAQARKPETCNNCHIGPDHPQWEIYIESPHGIAYHTDGQNWNWDKAAGTLTVQDFPAPTCATCHMSGFGASGTTHDVGDRLTWFSSSAISNRRPNWQGNLTQMQNVCRECHNQQFIDDFYTGADQAVAAVNNYVEQSNTLMQPLQDQKLLTAAPFDEPIDFTYFELWHHWGRTAKFGTWMQGPDYTQWHGTYEIIKAIADLKDMAAAKLNAASVSK